MKIPRRGFFGVLAGLAAAPWFGLAPAGPCKIVAYSYTESPWGHDVFVTHGHFRSERDFYAGMSKLKLRSGFVRKEQKVHYLKGGRVAFRTEDWSIRRNTV